MTLFNEESFVEALDGGVKEADHFGGKVDKLIVKFSVIFLQMRALHLESVLLQHLEIGELAHVDLLSYGFFLIKGLNHFKVHDEVLECVGDLPTVDIGTVENSQVLTRHGVGILNMMRCVGMGVWTLMDAVGHAQVGSGLDRCSPGGLSGVKSGLAHTSNK